MLTTLLGAAVRGGVLLAVVWMLMKTLRVRDPAAEKTAWTLVVGAALSMPLLESVAGVVAPPLTLTPLRMLPFGPVASTAALTGTAPVSPETRIELLLVLLYALGAALLLTRFTIGLWSGARLRRRASTAPDLSAGSVDVRVSTAIRSPSSFASTILLPPPMRPGTGRRSRASWRTSGHMSVTGIVTDCGWLRCIAPYFGLTRWPTGCTGICVL